MLLRPLYFLLGSEFKLNYLLQNNGVAVNGVTNGNNSWRKSHNKNFVGNQKHDASQRGGYVCFYCFLKEISYCCKISMTVILSLNWYKSLQIWQKAVSSSTECTRKLQVQQWKPRKRWDIYWFVNALTSTVCIRLWVNILLLPLQTSVCCLIGRSRTSIQKCELSYFYDQFWEGKNSF